MSEKIIQTMLRNISHDRIQHEGEVVVIGLGRFGSSLAHTLIDMGYEVLGVDFNEHIVQEHAGALTHVVQADTTNRRRSSQVGAADAVTAIVCIGTGVEASVLTATALVDLGVQATSGRRRSPVPTAGSSQRVGAHHVVYPRGRDGQPRRPPRHRQVIEYVALDEDFVMVEMTAPRELIGIVARRVGPARRVQGHGRVRQAGRPSVHLRRSRHRLERQ